MRKMKWKIVKENIIESYRFKIHEQKVELYENKVVPFSYVSIKDGICVMPVLPDGRIVCIKQYRHAVRSYEYEFPGGVLDEEDAAYCAEKELIEEVGYKARKIVSLGTIYPSAGASTEKVHLFLATELESVGQKLEVSEDIEICFLNKEQMLSMMVSGEFRHGSGIAAMFRYSLGMDFHKSN